MTDRIVVDCTCTPVDGFHSVRCEITVANGAIRQLRKRTSQQHLPRLRSPRCGTPIGSKWRCQLDAWHRMNRLHGVKPA